MNTNNGEPTKETKEEVATSPTPINDSTNDAMETKEELETTPSNESTNVTNETKEELASVFQATIPNAHHNSQANMEVFISLLDQFRIDNIKERNRYQEEMKTLQGEMKLMAKQQQDQTEKTEKKHQEEMKTLQGEMKLMAKKYQEEIKTLQGEMKLMAKKHQEEMKTLQDEMKLMAKKYQEEIKTLQGEMKLMAKKQQDQTEKTEKKHQEEIKTLRGEMISLKKDHKGEISNLTEFVKHLEDEVKYLKDLIDKNEKEQQIVTNNWKDLIAEKDKKILHLQCNEPFSKGVCGCKCGVCRQCMGHSSISQ
ncbi:predicted protein [Naegleria gruberi]|uniref:Predicted protein n=1 Tax=Naegleria gruberi TaxID=5762 RepID=D2VM96_NAEGR|nr:uncharacterized protein NAEGRDRAFT_70058 [Naegleria gruberi]EFC42024.1 predicted protein [Naegleria gruberi]|eukprot:XP_002674768.1 predicted protein [Naegleria gruberi strain NEG-M]